MRKGNFSFRLPPSRNPFLRLGAHPCITNEAPEVLDAPVRAQHHPDNMRPRRHWWSSATTCRHPRCGSHGQCEVKLSAHSVPSTVCAEGLAEMWREALERGGVQNRRRRTRSSRRAQKVNHLLRFCMRCPRWKATSPMLQMHLLG